MGAKEAQSILLPLEEETCKCARSIPCFSELSLSGADASTGRGWTGLKRRLGWVWPGCVRWKPQDETFDSRPLVPSRPEKKLLVLSMLWDPVSWSVQEGILVHPRGRIKITRALGTNNLLFVQTSTSSTMRVVLYSPLLLFSLLLPAAHSKNSAFNPFPTSRMSPPLWRILPFSQQFFFKFTSLVFFLVNHTSPLPNCSTSAQIAKASAIWFTSSQSRDNRVLHSLGFPGLDSCFCWRSFQKCLFDMTPSNYPPFCVVSC